MNYKLQAFLDQLELSKNEKKIYTTALNIGEVTVAELARRAGIHRVAAYALVEKMTSKGLLISSNKKGKRVMACSPRQIKKIIDRKQRQLRKLELKYDDVLPDLMAMYSSSGYRPRVQFFEGLKGIEQINQDIIDTLKELPEEERITYSYSNPEVIDELFEDYIFEKEGYVDQRKKFDIRNKAIASDSPVTQKISNMKEEILLDVMILPKDLFPFKNDITIYHNKIAIQALHNELVGVVIESEEIVKDQKAIFELAWAGAEALSQKMQ